MKEKTDVYDAIEWLGNRIKLRRLNERTGHTEAWFSQMLNNSVVNGKELKFTERELPILQQAWNELQEQISIRCFVSTDDKDVRNENNRWINKFFLQSFFCNVLDCNASYIDNRMRKNGKVRFNEIQIMKLNAAILSTAMQMRNTELVINKSE